MRTVANQAMMTHDHLCSPTNFVDNCSYIDFVIIGYVLKATIEWRVFLKMDMASVNLVVPLFAFVFLYLNTNMKSQRHSTCLSLRRCGCVRVSVCPSLPVCLSVSLPVSVFLCLSLSLSRSASLSVGTSVGLSVLLSVGPSVCLSSSVSVWCVSRKKCLTCLCVLYLSSPAHSQQLNHKRRRHG